LLCCQLVMLSTCYVVNLLCCQLVMLSTCYVVNLLCCQLVSCVVYMWLIERGQWWRVARGRHYSVYYQYHLSNGLSGSAGATLGTAATMRTNKTNKISVFLPAIYIREYINPTFYMGIIYFSL